MSGAHVLACGVVYLPRGALSSADLNRVKSTWAHFHSGQYLRSKKETSLIAASSMSPLALLLATRPGAGTGGAEAPPPCQRVHGAVLRPSGRRHRCGEPGAAREDTMLHGENQDRAKPPQSGAEPPLGDERPQKRPDDRATRAACGAKSPGPPAAAGASARQLGSAWR